MADAVEIKEPVVAAESAAPISMPDEEKEPVVNGSSENNDPVAPTELAKEVATEPVAPPTLPVPEAKVEPESTNPSTTSDKPISDAPPSDKPASIQEDIEMKDDIKTEDAAPAADEPSDPAVGDSSWIDNSKARRKYGALPEHKKKLNKKQSKAKMTHTDAQPGDYFFVRLKGYPLWPAIVCDETMLPSTLLKSRPVTAARPDGTYRSDYEDGGNKVKDRTFPVMYLHTNEFGWIPNFDLVDLDFDKVGEVSPNMRKDLHAAHLLAAERHDLDYFKEILKNFMEARTAELEAKEAAKAAKKASKAKRKSKTAIDGEDGEDVEMADAPVEGDSEEKEVEEISAEKPKKSKKRKAEDEAATPQRTDSVKKPKTVLKLTTTPKATNGTATPQTAKDSVAKSSKPKTKKTATPKVKEPEAATPKEPELTPEEKRVKKEKEILFLRHKLQKGLLTRDQAPKEEEMTQMSEFVSKLEGYADLEVAIIRATKINKVLKAILKLPSIPKEEELQFKPRSQTLLDKWNKLLATEQDTPTTAPTAPPSVAPTTTTNGASDELKSEPAEPKASPAAAKEVTNGIKEPSYEAKVEEKTHVVEEPVAVAKEESAKVEVAPAPAPVEEPAKESVAEPMPVESTA